MCAAIENAASCEVLWIIRFLFAKELKPIKMYGALYGVRKWCND